MRVIVCIKSVILHAPADWISSGGRTPRTPEMVEFNPFDRPALEVALRMREEQGGTVTALSMGPECAAITLYEALAMGADRAVLVCDPALAGSDTLATSTVLAAAIKKLLPFNLLLFGTRTADSDTGQVGPQTAVLLDLPLVTWAYSIESLDKGLRVTRRADGFREEYQVSLPAGLTVHPGAVPGRDLPLAGIEEAFTRGKVNRWSLSDLGLPLRQAGEAGSATRVLSMRRVSRERKCEFITGSSEEQAEELLKRLAESGSLA